MNVATPPAPFARLPLIVAQLAAGHLVVGAVFWLFLTVPESSVWMLGLSAVLVLAGVAVAAWTEVGGVIAWTRLASWRDASRRGLAGAPALIAAVGIFGAFWWLTGAAGAWLAAHAGEIDAWLIATFGWTETIWVHRALAAMLYFVRFILGLSFGVAALAFGALGGLRSLAGVRWLRAAVSRAHVGAVGLAFLLLIALPARAVYWRPEGLPPSWLEVAFVGAKLGAIYLLVNLGWAVILRTGAQGALRFGRPGADLFTAVQRPSIQSPAPGRR